MKRILRLCLLLALLPLVAWGQTPHDISTGTLTITGNGNYTVTGTTTTNRIIVSSGVTATLTLNGVSITGTELDDIYGTPASSPIDLADGATLTLVLADDSENTLTGGGGGQAGGDSAPGIHVPDDATLIIQGGGSLSVTGGASPAGLGSTGIGGKNGHYDEGGNYISGENCGTVIILSKTITVKGGSGSMGSTGADIGGGDGQNLHRGDDGQGIRPNSDGTFYVYGNLELPCDITIPEGATVNILAGASLTVRRA